MQGVGNEHAFAGGPSVRRIGRGFQPRGEPAAGVVAAAGQRCQHPADRHNGGDTGGGDDALGVSGRCLLPLPDPTHHLFAVLQPVRAVHRPVGVGVLMWAGKWGPAPTGITIKMSAYSNWNFRSIISMDAAKNSK